MAVTEVRTSSTSTKRFLLDRRYTAKDDYLGVLALARVGENLA